MKSDVRMAVIRPIGQPVSRSFYNSQEIGLARGLSDCGINVDVYVAGRNERVQCRDIDTFGAGMVRLFEVPFHNIPLIDKAIYPSLIALLQKGSYDFIQVNEESEPTSFWVARYARKSGIPVVVYQGMYEQIAGRIYSAFQWCYDILFLPRFRKYVDLALVKTSRAGVHLQSKGFDNIKLLPVGLDPTPFANPLDRNWRAEFAIPWDSSIILYVGIFERRRNVDFMVDLAKLLVGDGVTLVMAGVGPELDRIASRVGSEKISNVRLVGSVSQESLPSLYRESSLFLLPSNYEIYGMVVLEAMYFGVPVLSTRTAGPEDIIKDGVDGYLFDNLDPVAWVNIIRSTLSQLDRLAMMGKNAEAKVHGQLCWDTVACEYAMRVIEPLLS